MTPIRGFSVAFVLVCAGGCTGDDGGTTGVTDGGSATTSGTTGTPTTGGSGTSGATDSAGTSTTGSESTSGSGSTGGTAGSTGSSGSTGTGTGTGGSTGGGSTSSGSTGSTGGVSATGSTGGGSTSGSTSGGSTGTSTSTTTGATTGTTGGVTMDACGFPEDGPWVEIEYWQAGVPATSPQWSYSNTPGWGEAQWAAQGESWPEVWDVHNNIEVKNDPIGVLAEVDGTGELQLMIGLQDLISYDHATVCVEGRSVSAVASVIFDAYNPLNDCGDSTSMAHDWTVHAEGLNLGNCLIPGGGVQAVRIEPSGGSGSVGVMRMRLTLHGAVY